MSGTVWCPNCGTPSSVAVAQWRDGRNGTESRGSIQCLRCGETRDELMFSRTPPKPATFTFAEVLEAGPCVHSVRQRDCASCLRGMLWYEGRIDGLREAAQLLAANAAMADAMRHALDS